MGFFKKLFGTTVAVGAGAAGAVVAEKVKENNPDGITDVNNDGKVDYADYLAEVEKAVKELYSENAPVVKDAAQKKIDDIKAANPDAVAKINEVMDKVKTQISEIK